MKREFLTFEGVHYSRVTRKTAKTYFEAGKTVFVFTSNQRRVISIAFQVNNTEGDFISLCNSIEYYNCNNEMGSYLVFL